MRILLATRDATFASLLKEAARRFPFEWTTAVDGDAAQKAASRMLFDLAIVDFDLPPDGAIGLRRRLDGLDRVEPTPMIVRTHSEEDRGAVESEDSARMEVVPALAPMRRLLERMIPVLDRRTRVACIGGGTGLFTLLSGLKTIQGLSLSSIVAMTDDGGSTGRLRDRFGVLPPGDVRRSLIALSSAPDLLNRLMEFRFSGGGELSGHNLGNLILTALAEIRGSMAAAISSIGEILGIRGQVLPVTECETTLMACLKDGTFLSGENRIDVYEAADASRRIDRVWCEPTAEANPEALRALREADLIVLGPGDLFTSIIANLLVEGIPEAVRTSPAERVFVCNVMTEPGETFGFSVADHVRELLRYLGDDCLDHVLCSTTRFTDESLAEYARLGQEPVRDDPARPLAEATRARLVRADVASDSTLVRHDSLKLAVAMRDILRRPRSD